MQSKSQKQTHVYKLYNSVTGNRTTVKVEETKNSKKEAIAIAIKQHAKVIQTMNKPSNWQVERVLKTDQAFISNPKAKQPKAKSKSLMRSK
jgi:hypothetical protein